MGVIKIDDYLSPDQNQIFPDDVSDWIDALRAHLVEQAAAGSELDRDTMVEHGQLTEFRDRVERCVDNHFESVRIVPDKRFDDYVRGWVVQAGLVHESVTEYFKWQEFAAAHRTDGWVALNFGDDPVWVKA